MATFHLIQDHHLVDIKDSSPEKTALNDWFKAKPALDGAVLSLLHSFTSWDKEQV